MYYHFFLAIQQKVEIELHPTKQAVKLMYKINLDKTKYIFTLKISNKVNFIELPNVNPMLYPLKRSIVLLNLIFSFNGSFILT